jgi:hypothetical protein
MVDAIVVEDGSIVAGANSYVDVDDCRAYAANRGDTLSDNDTVATQLFKAMDYLGLYAERWRGLLVDETVQVLSWPRQMVMFNGFSDYFPSTSIPANLIAAQCQLVIEQKNGIELLVSSIPGLPVIREKVDVIETQYASPADLGGIDFSQPTMPLVAALLKPLLNVGFKLTTTRI